MLALAGLAVVSQAPTAGAADRVIARSRDGDLEVVLRAERGVRDRFRASVYLEGSLGGVALGPERVGGDEAWFWFPLQAGSGVRDLNLSDDPPRVSFRLALTASLGTSGTFRYRVSGEDFVRVNPGAGGGGTRAGGCPGGALGILRFPVSGAEFRAGRPLVAGVFCNRQLGAPYRVTLCLSGKGIRRCRTGLLPPARPDVRWRLTPPAAGSYLLTLTSGGPGGAVVRRARIEVRS